MRAVAGSCWRTVGCAHVHHAVAHGRRGDHPRFAGGIVPLLAAGGGVDGVHVRVAAADVDRAVHHCGRRLEPDLVVDHVVLARLERPPLLAALGVDRVEVAVPAPHVHGAIGHRRRRVHDVLGGELPLQDSRLRVERVDVPVATAEVHLAVRHRRRGGEDVPGVGDRLRVWRVPVQVLRFELPLVLGWKHPLRFAGCDLERGERARRRDEVEQGACDRGGRCDRQLRFEVPLLLAGVLRNRNSDCLNRRCLRGRGAWPRRRRRRGRAHGK